MNPHQKETKFIHYLEEETFYQKKWWDTLTWVEAGGLSLIICTVSINTGSNGNIGFRLVDENDEPLLPYRTTTNTRRVAHFSVEPNYASGEDLTPITFHMIVNCKYVKLQAFPDDGNFRINTIGYPGKDATWSHKPISTMSAIPLLPNYQPGANTIFSYPQSRMPKMDEKKDKTKPKSSAHSDS